jgi:hypothetical protein
MGSKVSKFQGFEVSRAAETSLRSYPTFIYKPPEKPLTAKVAKNIREGR